jgi:hypothetical protein
MKRSLSYMLSVENSCFMSNFFKEMKGCKFPYFMLNLTILLCYVKYRNLFKIDISWCIVFFGKPFF